MQMIFCECGCGEKRSLFDSKGRKRKFIKGHNTYGVKTPENVIKSKINIDENGCWIWNGYRRKNGYGVLTFKNKRYSSHRFSYQTFKGEIKKGMYICHKCNVPFCVNPDHLYQDSQKGNLKYSIDCGNMHYNRIISDEDIRKIRKLYGKHDGIYLSKKFNISKQHIYDIVNIKTRKDVI